MDLKYKLLSFGVLAILVLGLLRYCDRPTVLPPGKLAPGEKERVEVRGRTVIHITKDKTTKEYAPDGAKVSIGEDGKVRVDIRKFGFSHEPGFGYITTGDRLKPQLDLKWYFYHRAGIHTGLTFDTGVKQPLKDLKSFLHPTVFGTYATPLWNNRVSVGAGLELFPNKYMGIVRVAF